MILYNDYMRRLGLIIFLCLLNLSCVAASFSPKDGSFSISLPPKWQKIKTLNNEVLSLKKGTGKIRNYDGLCAIYK